MNVNSVIDIVNISLRLSTEALLKWYSSRVNLCIVSIISRIYFPSQFASCTRHDLIKLVIVAFPRAHSCCLIFVVPQNAPILTSRRGNILAPRPCDDWSGFNLLFSNDKFFHRKSTKTENLHDNQMRSGIVSYINVYSNLGGYSLTLAI